MLNITTKRITVIRIYKNIINIYKNVIGIYNGDVWICKDVIRIYRNLFLIFKNIIWHYKNEWEFFQFALLKICARRKLNSNV